MRTVFFLAALFSVITILPGCARKTGSIELGPDEPGFALEGENVRLNPGLFGYENGPGLIIDTYSNGEISVRMRSREAATARGKAF